MKNFIAALTLITATSAFAQQLTYENLPLVKLTVVSVDATNRVDAKHEQKKKEALEDLRVHVENTLGRQVIEAKCSSALTETFINKDFSQRKSICSVSFL